MENKNLCKIAIDNLLFLNKGDNFITNKYKLNHLSFESSEDEPFDTIYSLKELEYPLYFTINQLLNEIHTSYDYLIHGYHRKDILSMLDDVVEMLYQYYMGCEDKNILFESLLDDIDGKVFVTQGYYKYGICIWLPTKVKNYLNWFCMRSIIISKEIVNDYLEDMYSPGRYDDDSSDDDGSSDDVIESMDEVKESTDEVNESADEVNESADEVKESADEVKESTDDHVSKESSDEEVDSKKND